MTDGAERRAEPGAADGALARPHVRAQRVVGALAAAALIAGAIAVPFALRDRSTEPANPSEAAGGSGTRFQSTIVVRVEPAPSTQATKPLDITLTEPGQIAMRSGIRKAALGRSHLDADDPRVSFGPATADATGELSLTVTAPTGAQATALARDWATMLTKARIAEAKNQVRAIQHALAAQSRKLRTDLREVDEQLAQLAPGEYGDAWKYDSWGGHRPPFGGPKAPPPVPEQGSVKTLNLAFERIQILSKLTELGNQAATLRINLVRPDVFAQTVSQSPPVLIESPDESNPSIALIAGGLLLAGVVLAGSAFLLGRRSRRPQAS